jgi:hypothetical protein
MRGVGIVPPYTPKFPQPERRESAFYSGSTNDGDMAKFVSNRCHTPSSGT